MIEITKLKASIILKSKIAWASIIMLLIGLEPFLPQFDGILPDNITNILKVLVPLAIVYWRTTTTGVSDAKPKDDNN
ncbi:hypothetical protein UFOVP581_7 [uncultured Caudovirales phage]|uniref:Holin n=1 Tax=uncultured Caudovirales phage TaxID=2100421 RepID=A0A6J5PG52_9CAUD|nr:hypothetical protein UFOVP581_7 [uncultured Caudovirales phage]